MRIQHGAKVAMAAAAAALLLTACGTDSDAEAEATAAAADAPAASSVADEVNTAIGCEMFGGVWSAGDLADSAADEVYTCDADGDGVAETTLAIYASAEDAAADVAAVEGALPDAGIAQGEGFLAASTDGGNLQSIVQMGAEIVREIPAAG